MIEEINESRFRYKPRNTVESQGWGYVYLPPDIDPDVYAAHCRATYTICMMVEDALFYTPGVEVPMSQMEYIEFPLSTKESGSRVWYAVNPRTSFPTVINVYSKSTEFNNIGGIKSWTHTGETIAGILVDENENLRVFSTGEGDLIISNKNGGNLIVSSTSIIDNVAKDLVRTKTAKLDILAGDLDQNNTHVYLDQNGLVLEDKYGNKIEMNKDLNVYSPNKVKVNTDNGLYLNKGDDNAVLGNKLLLSLNSINGILSDICEALLLIPTPGAETQVNPAFSALVPPILVELNSTLQEYQNILSKSIFVS